MLIPTHELYKWFLAKSIFANDFVPHNMNTTFRAFVLKGFSKRSDDSHHSRPILSRTSCIVELANILAFSSEFVKTDST